MADELDLHVHTYAVARLAGIEADNPVANALRAILGRSFPAAHPAPAKQRRREQSKERRQRAEPIDVERARPARPGKDFGYSPESGALWIARNALPNFRNMPKTWRKKSTAEQMFDAGHELFDAIREFARNPNGLSRWKTDPNLLQDILTAVDRRFFDEVFATERSISTIACQGVPVIGTAEGIVWIGLTYEVQILDEPPATRAAFIREQGQRTEELRRKDRETIAALRMNASREYDMLVLQAIYSVEHFGISPAPDYLVRLIADTFTTNSPATDEARAWKYRDALFRLEQEDWIALNKHAPTAWRALLKPDWRIGILPLPEWALRHRDDVKKKHWQALLGAQAVRSIFNNDELLLPIINSVAKTLTPDDEVLTVYAERLAEAASTVHGYGGERLLHRAEELLDAFRGEPQSACKAWVTIAAKHLRSGIRSPEFYLAVAKLDEEGLRMLAQSESWHLRHEFERLAWGAIRAPEHLPSVRRLANVLDAIPDHWFKERRYAELLNRWCEEAAAEEPSPAT